MGDAFGDVIYILVMLAALVYSVIRKAKSGEQEDTVLPEREGAEMQDDAFPPYDDWFDDDEKPEKGAGQQASVEQMQPEKMKPEKLEYKRPVYKSLQKKDRLEPQSREKYSPKSRRRTVRTSLAKEEEKDYGKSVWGIEDFDLKKAIIYSEIIKRPTF